MTVVGYKRITLFHFTLASTIASTVNMLPVIAAAVCLYFAVSGLIWLHATGGANAATNKVANKLATPAAIRLLVAAVVVLHALQLYEQLYRSGGHGVTNLALGHAVSLVAWTSVTLFLVASLVRRVLNLGVVVLPSGLFGFIIGVALPGEAFFLESLPRGAGWHIAIAIPAYGVLSIAFAQALLLWMHEKQLRRINRRRLFPALPALETMESNLLHLIVLGFALLTVNLLTGMISTHRSHGVLLLFNHHILLSLLAWAGFGALLAGRALFGWRGQMAAQWTIAAFAVLALAYFGTRFVQQVILQD